MNNFVANVFNQQQLQQLQQPQPQPQPHPQPHPVAIILQAIYRRWNRDRAGVRWVDQRLATTFLHRDLGVQQLLQDIFTTYSIGCLNDDYGSFAVRFNNMNQYPTVNPINTGFFCYHQEGKDAYETTSGEEEDQQEQDELEEDMN